MKKTITITNNGATLFKGKPLNMPFKHEAIREKSIELFDDEDPCIIHQSHIAREFSDTVLKRFADKKTDCLSLNNEQDIQNFLDVPPTSMLNLKG